MLEEIKENPGKYIKSLAMDIVVVIVSFAYIFYQLLSFELTDLNPLVLLAQSVVSIICGVVIKQSLGENGFSKGYNSNTWNDELKLYNEACNSARDYLDRCQNFYIAQRIEKRANYRRAHLQAAELRYKDWFDEHGNYIGNDEKVKKLKRWQRRVVRKCVRVKIYVLDLFSEYDRSIEEDTKPEMTDARRRGINIASNSIYATLIAIVGVYFIPILNWNWASIIAATFQVALWILFGILQLYKNYNFVIHTRVSILRTKKQLIGLFNSQCKNGMHTRNPYEEQDNEPKAIIVESVDSVRNESVD